MKSIPFLLAILALALPLSSRLAADEAALKTYYEKLAKVSPRDANGFFGLSQWCQTQGLGTQTRQLLERVIRIDTDHPEARKALGYRRHGLEWRLGDVDDPDGPSEEVSDGEADAAEADTEPDLDPPESEEGPGDETATEVVNIEDLIAKRKAWAKEAAETIDLRLNVYEDRDFLIHTSYPINSRQVRTLLTELKKMRSSLQKILGVSSSAEIWPAKYQFFYLRSVECVAFSERVLGRAFPERDGWDLIDDRSLLIQNIAADELTRFVARTAPDNLGGSDRWVGGWIGEGIGELVASQTKPAKDAGIYEDNYRLIGRELERDPEGYFLQDLLDEPEMDEGNSDRSRSLAMTLVDFLYTAKRRNFSKFVADLKDPSRASPPADRESAEFRKFFIKYIGYQEDLFSTHFRLKPEPLEKKWREFVLKKIAVFEKKRGDSPEPRERPRDRRRRGGTGGGNRERKP